MVTRRNLLAFISAGLMASVGLSTPVWAQNLPQVTMETSLGNIVIELDKTSAPVTVENFLHYTSEGYYNGTIFHRVIDGFMIQGGGFTADMKQKETHAPIKLEASKLLNRRGTIAMARTGNPHSATSQFFINVVDNHNLNAPNPDGYGYTVFGYVVQGMDVVDQIRKVKTGTAQGHQNVPTTPVVIHEVRLTRP